jgi:hypothetical protein
MDWSERFSTKRLNKALSVGPTPDDEAVNVNTMPWGCRTWAVWPGAGEVAGTGTVEETAAVVVDDEGVGAAVVTATEDAVERSVGDVPEVDVERWLGVERACCAASESGEFPHPTMTNETNRRSERHPVMVTAR